MQNLIPKIQPIFNKVIEYSQFTLPFKDQKVHSDDLFAAWVKNKQHIYKIFGNKLITEVPGVATFHLDDKERERQYKAFVVWLEGIAALNNGIFDFLEEQKAGFFDNKVIKDYNNIRVGMKLSKALKFYIDNPYTLRRVQDKYSTILQKDNITGVIQLSIHPLDYLSSSENACNWRSCHSLDGDYWAGNLSYMADPSTIVCYIKTDKDVQLPNFPKDVLWNSKQWRMLLHLEPRENDLMIAGRQYPFFLNGVLEKISNELDSLVQAYNTLNKKAHWSPPRIWERGQMQHFDKNYAFGEYHYQMWNFMIPLRVLYESPFRSWHFNDIEWSNVYPGPHVSFTSVKYIYRIPVGWSDKKQCLTCGKELSDSGFLICPDCNGKITDPWYCDDCGRAIRKGEEIRFEENGMLTVVCSDCMQQKEKTQGEL